MNLPMFLYVIAALPIVAGAFTLVAYGIRALAQADNVREDTEMARAARGL